MSQTVFVSYRSLEPELALRLAVDLKNAGVPIWMDRLEGILVGEDWRVVIEAAIANSSLLLAVVSPAYVKARYCQRELARADDLGIRILPILLETVPVSDWPLELQRVQYEDFTGWREEATYRTRLDALLRQVRATPGVRIGAPPDAESRYLLELIGELEAKRGVLQYVELVAAAEAAADHRPPPATDDEWGFQYLLSQPKSVKQDVDATTRATSLLPSIAVAAEQFPRFAILGAPGAGKTTALRRLARDMATRRLHEPQRAPMPLWIDLAKWEHVTLLEMIRSRWQLPGDPASLLRTGDLRLFLDGFNEMGDRSREHAEQLRGWLSSSDAPSHVVVACRADDYASEAMRLGDLPTVLIQELVADQVRRFASGYLEKWPRAS